MNKAKMNKAMKKAALAFFLPLLLASADGSGSQDQIGETVYTDGDVSVTRDGSPLSSDEVVIGLPIDNFDFMKTGDDGNAQVKVTTNRAPQSTITVSPDTQFTFELSTLQGRQTSSVNLISGSLSMKVSTLTGDQDLDVQTENTVLGVRGTEFAVTTSDAGDVLVTCSTGDVSCRTENGPSTMPLLEPRWRTRLKDNSTLSLLPYRTRRRFARAGWSNAGLSCGPTPPVSSRQAPPGIASCALPMTGTTRR